MRFIQFIQTKSGEYRHVLESKNGILTVQDSKGVQSKITPEEIGTEITRWYKIIQLVLQFAAVLIGMFKKG